LIMRAAEDPTDGGDSALTQRGQKQLVDKLR
jgi:hypothetical protein